MLAKIWKKLLLAICIIACIYNVMNKLVSRTSLEAQLKSVELNPLTSDEEHETSQESKSSKINKTSKKEENENEDDDNNDDENFVVVFDE